MKQSREEQLNERMREHRKLCEERKKYVTENNRAHRRLQKINAQIASVGQAIYALKHDGQTPTVTDHAIVRYLERVKHMNIDDLKLEVATHKNAYREGNVVVTVNEDIA